MTRQSPPASWKDFNKLAKSVNPKSLAAFNGTDKTKCTNILSSLRSAFNGIPKTKENSKQIERSIKWIDITDSVIN